MDPDMKSVHVHKTDFSTPSWESTRTLESDRELRVHMERAESPAPSYLSMKTHQSMETPNSFKEGDFTQKEGVHLERAESPSQSCVSEKTDQSIDPPVSFKEEDPSQQEDIRPGEVVCDVCESKL
ncbi:uncharacterized protein LOC112261254 [Oncorhynchus tshawytscha]|uniref:uncharacterized protein LOC112261254 n=1 Tax=Oncorhynchus tshawytscha TaxID=74940 RepID=UPI001C3C9DC6|nr:uncharacterized protein LOC112261254 [Oncorhynchus tshawytscha]XP_042169909.1 uncharacterized protein LOC112261254 [Oncorhynchus tshawytscha]